jgi:hypothetical protein
MSFGVRLGGGCDGCFSSTPTVAGKEKLAYISAARRLVIGWEPAESAYQLIKPADVLFEGKSTACVKPISRSGTGYLYQHFAAANYRNKRVKYSLFIKTKRLRSGARLFVDMYDADSQDLLSIRLDPAVTGTKDWRQCEYEFDVPIEAYAISIGATIDGPGGMYLGGLKFEIIESM